jgi:hypothetical protein
VFWSTLPTPLVLSSELELSELEVDDDGVLVPVEPRTGVVVLEPVDEFELVDVPVCASALLLTPATRPTVRAPAARAAALPTTVARVRSARAFMTITIAALGSARRHHNVKASSSLAGCWIRERRAPA